MALFLNSNGAKALLRYAFNKYVPTGGSDLIVKLNTNPAVSSFAQNTFYFQEPSGGGYFPQTILPSEWTVSIVDGIAQAEYNFDLTFTFTGPLEHPQFPTIHGYYIVDADGTLIYHESSPVTLTPENPGESIIIRPKFKLSAGTPVSYD